MSWDRVERNVSKGPWAAFLTLVLIIVPMIMILSIGGCMMGFIANPFVQAGRVINKTIDADNVIYNYEWFKSQHESILAMDTKIKDADRQVSNFQELAGERKDWHREDREEFNRLNAVVLGIKQQREDAVATYNARSRMVNRSIFKTGDLELPERIK